MTKKTKLAIMPTYRNFQEWYAFFGGEEMQVSRDEAAKIWSACESLYNRDGKKCAWTYDEDTCSYDTECGHKWVFLDGSPKENEVVFCHACGKKVIVK
jgi:DNA-directed RNA polymerase subunit RPC12/RpoP